MPNARHVLHERVTVSEQGDREQTQRSIVDDDGTADDLAQLHPETPPFLETLSTCGRWRHGSSPRFHGRSVADLATSAR